MRRSKVWNLNGITVAELVQCKAVLAKVPARVNWAYLRFGDDLLHFERTGDDWTLCTVS